MKKLLILVSILIAVIVVSILSQNMGGHSTLVEQEILSKRIIRSSILASGKLAHANEVRLTTQLIGKIKKIFIKEGDKVKQSQLVLQIDNEEQLAVVEQSKASVNIQQSSIEGQILNLENLQRQWRRKNQLFKKQLIKEDAFDEITYKLERGKIDLKSNRASLLQSQAKLQQDKNSLNKANVYSPIDGVVTSLSIKVGETAISGTTNIEGSSLMTIADPESIYTEVNVDEADIANVELNQLAEIIAIAYPDQPLTGVVESIANTAKVEKGRKGLSFIVKIRLDNKSIIKLRPGMSCRAEIFINSKKEVVAVPVQSILVENDTHDKTKYYVFVNRDDVAEKVEVTTGISDDNYQEIKSGVEIEDRIIIGPNRVLRHLKQGDTVNSENS